MQWPPDYRKILEERQRRYLATRKDPKLIRGAKLYYAENPHDFIEHWGITYDPRNAMRGLLTTMPFILFPRQHELVTFVLQCIQNREAGLIEKSRDMGATWLCCWISVWLWLFMSGVSVGWGSRKEQLVDKLGDPDSIFEKMRMAINAVPAFLVPSGFNPKEHSSYMKLLNPENGATITGEAGDNIGRGGRKTVYFKDEASHYEHPELIEASLGDNTDVQIDISSVRGTNTVFYRRRESGEIWEHKKKISPGLVRVFILDWRDHPAKDEAWYERRRQKAEREGLLHKFAEEIDRDPTASVERILIPAQWVKAAIDAHIKLKFSGTGKTYGGLDVADEGRDKNALVVRKGSIAKSADDWARGDTSETANKAVSTARQLKIDSLQYDCIGVGAGIKGETNRLKKEGLLPEHLEIVPWNAAAGVQNPDDYIFEEDDDDGEGFDSTAPRNKDFYLNLKSQAWWSVRTRFYNTYQAVVHGKKYSEEEMISIPSEMENRHQLTKELSQPTYIHKNGKVLVDKKPSGAKSPNLADAFVMAYFPIEETVVEVW